MFTGFKKKKERESFFYWSFLICHIFTIHVDKIKLWEVPVTNKCVACAQIGIHSFNGHIRGLRGTSALHATEGLRVRDAVTVHTSVSGSSLKKWHNAHHSCAYQQNLEK